MLKQTTIIVFAFCSLSACTMKKKNEQKPELLAKQLFYSVYGDNQSDIDSLISDDIVASYPIFKRLYGTMAIRGREAYKRHVLNFNQEWTDGQITINEAIVEDKSVVLVWTFRAVSKNTAQDSSIVAGKEYNWGGITLFHFNDSGKINLETGEESSPGPIERLEPETVFN